MRKTTLKRTRRGYPRNLGKLPNGSQPKFYLGHDKDAAVARNEAIETLWAEFTRKTGRDVWDQWHLDAAKAVARGEPLVVRRFDHEPEDNLFRRFNEWSRKLKVPVVVDPSHQHLFDLGREAQVRAVLQSQEQLAESLGTPNAVGQNLHDAIEAYRQHVQRDYLDPTDGALTDNGKTKIDQLKTIMTYVPNLDLGAIDYHGTDELFAIFRRRPVSKRYGNPMRRKSCSNYIGELGRFLHWMHLSKDWNWRKPEDYDAISRRPRELDVDVEHEAKEVETWTIAELKLLNEYALPIERVFLLLGLNCSYGADQAGRLRVRHLRFADEEGKRSFIKRTRRKKKTLSQHLLWRQTEQALRWAMDRRKKQNHPDDFLLLTDNLHPYWDKTKAGNRKQAIPNMWNRLLDRVSKDHKIRRLPFNSLRDTSATFIRNIAGGETASLHLAHKHQSKDENLRRYTNPLCRRHNKALRRLERMLQPVFDAAGPEPFATRQKYYIGLAKVKKIRELYESGMAAAAIAEAVGVSTTTVYRYLPNEDAAASAATDSARSTHPTAESPAQPTSIVGL